MGKGGQLHKIKDGNWRLALGEGEVQSVLRIYIIWIMDTQEQVAVHMCGFDGFQRGNYFRGEPIWRTEVEVRVGKFKNEMAAGKNEVTGEGKEWR